jgi:hypothetical protein
MYTYTVCISKAEVLTITPLRTIHRVLDTPCGPDRERTLARSLACFRGVRTLAGLGGQASEAVYRGGIHMMRTHAPPLPVSELRRTCTLYI